MRNKFSTNGETMQRIIMEKTHFFCQSKSVWWQDFTHYPKNDLIYITIILVCWAAYVGTGITLSVRCHLFFCVTRILRKFASNCSLSNPVIPALVVLLFSFVFVIYFYRIDIILCKFLFVFPLRRFLFNGCAISHFSHQKSVKRRLPLSLGMQIPVSFDKALVT